MKVFARYYKISDFEFRTNTVLQFGSSFDIIGAAVLLNPGSAKPVSEIEVNSSELQKLYSLTGYPNSWYIFSADPTMRFLENIFNGKYAGKKIELNGIILLFNLLNLRNQNSEDALRKYNEFAQKQIHQQRMVTDVGISSEDMRIISSIKKVYLGWGKKGKSEILKPFAESVFNSLTQEQKSYLNPNFEDNSFYHPMYINRQIKYNKNAQVLMEKFCEI